MTLFNFYEDSTNKEWNLYDNMTREFNDQFGIPIKFLKRSEVNEDHIFGEDPLSEYNSSIDMKMFLTTPEIYNGGGDVFQKFGFQIDDSLEFFINKTEIENALGECPEVSDLVYIPFIGRLFEISYCKDDDHFYSFGKKMVYNIKLKHFEYSGEKLDTSETEIDDISDIFSEMKSEEETEANNQTDEIMDFDDKNPYKGY